MNTKNVAIARAYYAAMIDKNMEVVEKYLHPDVRLISPFARVDGKEAVLGAARGFAALLQAVTIRSGFGSDNQAMLAYDLTFPAPIGLLRAAVLMTFCEDRIREIELFYDARPFEQKKDAIFAQ